MSSGLVAEFVPLTTSWRRAGMKSASLRSVRVLDFFSHQQPQMFIFSRLW